MRRRPTSTRPQPPRAKASTTDRRRAKVPCEQPKSIARRHKNTVSQTKSQKRGVPTHRGQNDFLFNKQKTFAHTNQTQSKFFKKQLAPSLPRLAARRWDSPNDRTKDFRNTPIPIPIPIPIPLLTTNEKRISVPHRNKWQGSLSLQVLLRSTGNENVAQATYHARENNGEQQKKQEEKIL